MSSSEAEKTEVENYRLPRFDSPEVPKPVKFPFTRFSLAPETSIRPWDPTQEARRIIEEATAKAQHLERRGYEEGFQMGLQAGREVGEKSLEPSVKRFHAMLEALDQEIHTLSARREQDLVELVLIITAKVIENELSVRPESIRKVVARGFGLLSKSEGLKVRVNPQDYEILRQTPKESWGTEIEVIPDNHIAAGGFWLTSSDGEIDGSREGRWAQVARVVEEVLHGAPADGLPD